MKRFNSGVITLLIIAADFSLAFCAFELAI